MAAGVYKRENGTYCSRFTVNGRRYAVYGQTVKECRAKELERRQEIEAGTYRAGRKQTVQEYGQQCIEDKRGTVKESTIRTQHILFRMLCRTQIDRAGTQFGGLKLGDVEAQNVRAVQATLKAQAKTHTVNDCIALLRSIFKQAVNEQLVSGNPAALVKPLKRTEEPARDNIHRALTEAETAAFMDAARARNSIYCNLYVFLLNTGCRIGEAAPLKETDIVKGQVHIIRTVIRAENCGYLIGEDTKTAAGRRTIPLTQDARQALADQRRQNEIVHGAGIAFDKPIFRPIRGSVLKGSCVNEDIARICVEAGIDRFTVHAFRDTFATRCVESGMQPKTLQDILGHTDINMTMALYAHVMDETKAQQIAAVKFGT